MHRVFEVETALFKGLAPRPEAINELIGGDEMANWLHNQLEKRVAGLSEIWAEDHGWAFQAEVNGRQYLVVCSCDFENTRSPATWHAVQVADKRSLMDKLLGRNKTPISDPLVEIIRETLRSNPHFSVLDEKDVQRR